MSEERGLKLLRMIGFSLLLLLADNIPLSAQTDMSELLATVGKQEITSVDVETRLNKLSPDLKSIFEGKEGKEKLLKELIRIETFSLEARAVGLDKTEDFKNKMAELTKTMLAAEYTRQMLLKARVSEKEAELFHREHGEDFIEPEKIKVSAAFLRIPDKASPELTNQIEEKAKQILEKIKKGDDFSKLQADEIEVNSGYFAKGRLVPELEDKVFALNPGEISPVLRIKTAFAVFKLEDKIPSRPATFSEVKDQIIEKLREERQTAVFEAAEKKLFTKYNVVFKNQNASMVATCETKEGAAINIKWKVTEIIPAKEEIRAQGFLGTVMIEDDSQKENPQKIALDITKDTRILKEGNAVIFEALKVGQYVMVKFSGPITLSYPSMAKAEEIVILSS